MRQTFESEPPIHRAARTGASVELGRLLALGADINARFDVAPDYGAFWRGLTPLMTAAYATEGATVDTLRWLLEHGANLHARSDGGVTAAWYAAGGGPSTDVQPSNQKAELVARLRFLLDAGLGPNERLDNGSSLLTRACTSGDPARVALLLERGASVEPMFDVDAERKRRDRLYGSIFADLDLSDELADQIRPGRNGRPSSSVMSLFCAAVPGSAACVQLLLNAGADPDARDDQEATPLMQAQNEDTVRALLAVGADVHAVDTRGYDAFQHLLGRETASSDEQADLYQALHALMDAGVDINAELQYEGWTRLYHAAFAIDVAAVERLLQLRADPTRGRTPLHAPCWHSSGDRNEPMARVIDSLVAAGCDVNARDAAGDTLLHCAVRGYGHAPSEDVFNMSSDGSNLVATLGLLKHGALPDPVGRSGYTPLMLAAVDGSVKIVRELLLAGADPQRRNENHQTAADIAHKALKRYERAYESAEPEHKAFFDQKRQEATACRRLLRK
jgi:ankyrin repeat protein